MKKTEETGDFCAGANLTRSDPSTAAHQFLPLKKNSEAQEKRALFNGLEVGSFKTFLVVDLEFLATQAEKRETRLGEAGEKHVTTPRCPSRPRHSSSRRPRPPHRHRHSSNHRRGRSLRRGPGHVCGRSTRPVWWAPSHRHAQLRPW